MEIKKVEVGDLCTNCYILIEKNNCIIIDPGDNASKIIGVVGNRPVKTILITHNHFDHIGALEELKKYYNVKSNDFFAVDNMEVINTNGHTNDSKTFFFPKERVMFCGDFLFNNSFGRIDLGGNNMDMITSLEKISSYDNNIMLYPGHGEKFKLGNQKKFFKSYIEYLERI